MTTEQKVTKPIGSLKAKALLEAHAQCVIPDVDDEL